MLSDPDSSFVFELSCVDIFKDAAALVYYFTNA
ncbi:hypothetical protein HDF14_002220 [Edaphobacter lichenicola]|jgi:hypothetical protein|uniref:Uncharacterized protein n=1 Tax=Tunturiibacter gelidiferens TaxID=3069689 RepID=A0A9X0QDZ1_9BACT|nr:hypothetical protein [Edaphobacter lichenicola]